MNGSAGRSVSASATLGDVSATLRATSTNPESGDPALDPAYLTISVGAVQAFSHQLLGPTGLRADAGTTTTVIPWSLSDTPADPAPATSLAQSPGWTSLCLASFAGGGEPTVLVGMDTGGAHCCTLVRAYAVSGTVVAPYVQQMFGDPDGSLVAEGNQAILVTADDAFAYQYCAFACSGLPIEVLEFESGAFANTTRQHPDLVTKDAASWWAASQQASSSPDPLGMLAAWTADECTLGDGSSAFATLSQLAAQGKLTVSAADTLPGMPDGAAYVTSLKTFLAQHGYC